MHNVQAYISFLVEYFGLRLVLSQIHKTEPSSEGNSFFAQQQQDQARSIIYSTINDYEI